MIKKIYSIYDRKALEYGPLFEAKNDDIAKRMTAGIVASNKLLPVLDMELYCVGDFDDERAQISNTCYKVLNLSDIIGVQDDKHKSE